MNLRISTNFEFLIPNYFVSSNKKIMNKENNQLPDNIKDQIYHEALDFVRSLHTVRIPPDDGWDEYVALILEIENRKRNEKE